MPPSSNGTRLKRAAPGVWERPDGLSCYTVAYLEERFSEIPRILWQQWTGRRPCSHLDQTVNDGRIWWAWVREPDPNGQTAHRVRALLAPDVERAVRRLGVRDTVNEPKATKESTG